MQPSGRPGLATRRIQLLKLFFSLDDICIHARLYLGMQHSLPGGLLGSPELGMATPRLRLMTGHRSLCSSCFTRTVLLPVFNYEIG